MSQLILFSDCNDNGVAISCFLISSVSFTVTPVSVLQRVNQRVWRLTRSRRHSSLTPPWQRSGAGLSHTTSYWQTKSWRCGRRTLRVLVIVHTLIQKWEHFIWAWEASSLAVYKVSNMALSADLNWNCWVVLTYDSASAECYGTTKVLKRTGLPFSQPKYAMVGNPFLPHPKQ